MTNKEKYAKEILECVCKTGGRPAVVYGQPIACLVTDCDECDFRRSHDCDEAFVAWANEECETDIIYDKFFDEAIEHCKTELNDALEMIIPQLYKRLGLR